jgi:hypothetical protein
MRLDYVLTRGEEELEIVVAGTSLRKKENRRY